MAHNCRQVWVSYSPVALVLDLRRYHRWLLSMTWFCLSTTKQEGCECIGVVCRFLGSRLVYCRLKSFVSGCHRYYILILLVLHLVWHCKRACCNVCTGVLSISGSPTRIGCAQPLICSWLHLLYVDCGLLLVLEYPSKCALGKVQGVVKVGSDVLVKRLWGLLRLTKCRVGGALRRVGVYAYSVLSCLHVEIQRLSFGCHILALSQNSMGWGRVVFNNFLSFEEALISVFWFVARLKHTMASWNLRDHSCVYFPFCDLLWAKLQTLLDGCIPPTCLTFALNFVVSALSSSYSIWLGFKRRWCWASWDHLHLMSWRRNCFVLRTCNSLISG